MQGLLFSLRRTTRTLAVKAILCSSAGGLKLDDRFHVAVVAHHLNAHQQPILAMTSVECYPESLCAGIGKRIGVSPK